MTSTFRLLLAAVPDIATACEKITDPHLRDRAFDVLVAAAQDSGPAGPTYGGGIAPDTSYNWTTPSSTLAATYDPTSTRVDTNGRG